MSGKQQIKKTDELINEGKLDFEMFRQQTRLMNNVAGQVSMMKNIDIRTNEIFIKRQK